MNWHAALERTVTGMGYELVDVERSARGLLRVTIDRVPGSQACAGGAGDAVTVQDCEAVTRQLQLVLEVEGADYARLEVSSPGLDRPLKRPADWRRFAGAEIELTLRQPFRNRRHWRGTLVAGESDAAWRLVLPREPVKGAKAGKGGKAGKVVVEAAVPEQTLDFALDEVREARLVPVVDFKGRRAAVQQAHGGQE